MAGPSVSPVRSRSADADTVAVALPLAAGLGGALVLVLGLRSAAPVGQLAMVVAMTLAMMSPYAVPLARAVARATLWWQATQAVVVAVVTFFGLWCVASAVLHLAGTAMSLTVGSRAALALLALVCAIVVQRRGRTALLQACAVTRPVRPAHPARDAGRWAALAGGRCVRVCAAPMTLMAIEPSLAGFAGVTTLLWIERFTGRPALRYVLAAGYLAIGAALIATARSVSTPIVMPLHTHG
jgi:hypothetical protein